MTRFVDSSVILRYLTSDDPDRGPIARSIIESRDRLLISCVILLEVAYVLRRGYGFDRRTILDTLSAFVQRDNIEITDVPKGHLVLALAKARDRAALSLGDALILAQMNAARRREIYSFDTRFRDADILVHEAPQR